ncbi:MAG TPA: type II CAAX endopeptidase family protein [Blastocatellia bacterium]
MRKREGLQRATATQRMNTDPVEKNPEPSTERTGSDPNPALNTVLTRVFMTDEGEFRSGWRVFAFVMCLAVVALLVNAFLQAILGLVAPSLNAIVYPPPSQESQSAAQLSVNAKLLGQGAGSFIDLICAAIASAACAHFLEHRSFGSIGFAFQTGFGRDFSLGLIAGAAMICGVAGLEALPGSVGLSIQAHTATQDLCGFGALFVVFGFAAAFEELVFRGFAFQALAHDIGPGLAIAITSVGFGLVHLQNPSASAISTANTILAGIWLGLAYLKTRSLWLCTGLHLSWNFVMVFVFGLPVSGLTDFVNLGIFLGQDKLPLWMSGGTYGPEGGLAAVPILIISSLVLWKTGLFRPTPYMLEAVKHGKPEARYISLSLDRPDAKH